LLLLLVRLESSLFFFFIFLEVGRLESLDEDLEVRVELHLGAGRSKSLVNQEHAADDALQFLRDFNVLGEIDRLVLYSVLWVFLDLLNLRAIRVREIFELPGGPGSVFVEHLVDHDAQREGIDALGV
jgi:hypothetical protein